MASNFNPMKEDYKDKNFNAYVNQGFRVLSSMETRQHQLMSEAQSRTLELHVSRIPIELSDVGLQNLFGQFGTVLKVFVAKPKPALNQKTNLTWGKVTYSNLSETQRAIENLHMKPPHYFVVNHSISNEERERTAREQDERNEEADHINARRNAYEKGIDFRDLDKLSDRNLGLTKLGKENAYPKLRHGLANDRANGEGLSSGREDEWFQNNNANIRIPLNITIQPTFDRSPFMYGTPKVFSNSLIGPCIYYLCDRDGRVKCSICKSWYCSQSCQVNDWPSHKVLCRPIPQLENPDGSIYIPSSTLREPSKEPIKSTKPTYELPAPLVPDVVASKDSVPKEEPPVEKVTPEIVSKESTSFPPTETSSSKPVEDQKSIAKASPESAPVSRKEEAPNARHSPLAEVVQSNFKEESTVKKVDKFVAAKSILEDYSKEKEFVVCVDSTTEGVSALIAMVNDDKIVNCLFSDLNNVAKVRLEAVSAGEFVLVYDSVEKIYGRCFVLDAADDFEIHVIDIDTLKPFKTEIKKVYQYAHGISQVPAAGICMMSRGVIPDQVEKYLQSLVDRNSNEIVVKMKEINFSSEGYLKNCVGIIMDGTRQIFEYLIQPWTAMDPRIPKLLGFKADVIIPKPISQTTFEDMNDAPLKINDNLIFINFGPSSNQLVVCKEENIIQEEDLHKAMENIRTQGKEVNNVEKGLVFACKWSEDGNYYRALVNNINVNLKKVRVRFIDYGNQAEEGFESLRLLSEEALKIPVLAKLINLVDVPEQPVKDPQIGNRLDQLRPLFEVSLSVRAIENQKFVVSHPNGSLINDLIAGKLKEEMDAPIPHNIQGQEMGNEFSYDKVYTAALNANDPNTSQSAVVLHAESPTSIYVCPLNQVGVADSVASQVNAYAEIDPKMVGYAPSIGKLCVVKSKEDDGWYRGACVQLCGDEFEIFLVDYGFREVLPRDRIKMMDPSLMKTVFLANHCILDGFENEDLVDSYQKLYGPTIKDRFPFATEVKIRVVKHVKDKGYYVIRMPKTDDIDPTKVKKSNDEKELKIKELEAQLAKLRSA